MIKEFIQKYFIKDNKKKAKEKQENNQEQETNKKLMNSFDFHYLVERQSYHSFSYSFDIGTNIEQTKELFSNLESILDENTHRKVKTPKANITATSKTVTYQYGEALGTSMSFKSSWTFGPKRYSISVTTGDLSNESHLAIYDSIFSLPGLHITKNVENARKELENTRYSKLEPRDLLP